MTESFNENELTVRDAPRRATSAPSCTLSDTGDAGARRETDARLPEKTPHTPLPPETGRIAERHDLSERKTRCSYPFKRIRTIIHLPNE